MLREYLEVIAMIPFFFADVEVKPTQRMTNLQHNRAHRLHACLKKAYLDGGSSRPPELGDWNEVLASNLNIHTLRRLG